jgi:RNA polymerase primary sigma factor
MARTARNSYGPEDQDLVRLYLDDIARYPLLTKADEARLGAVMEEGTAARTRLEAGGRMAPGERAKLRRSVRASEEAAETFVRSNLRLVVSVAKRYQWSGLPLLDLVQEGNVGLIRAVEKFDYRKGFKFSTYATWWIRQAIGRGVANTARTIRLPIHVVDQLDSLRKMTTQMESDLGRAPKPEELSVELGWNVSLVKDLQSLPAEPGALDAPLTEDSDEVIGDRIADRGALDPLAAAMDSLVPAAMDRYLSILDEQERDVVRLRYGLDQGEPRTLGQVGLVMDLTGERVRQIERKAMAKLRAASVDFEARDLLAA